MKLNGKSSNVLTNILRLKYGGNFPEQLNVLEFYCIKYNEHILKQNGC